MHVQIYYIYSIHSWALKHWGPTRNPMPLEIDTVTGLPLTTLLHLISYYTPV